MVSVEVEVGGAHKDTGGGRDTEEENTLLLRLLLVEAVHWET